MTTKAVFGLKLTVFLVAQNEAEAREKLEHIFNGTRYELQSVYVAEPPRCSKHGYALKDAEDDCPQCIGYSMSEW